MTERQLLMTVLDEAREALIRKVTGVSEAAARATPTVSSLSLLGLVRHSAVWEHRWLAVVFAGRADPWPGVVDARPEATFAVGATETVADVVASYRSAIVASNAILSAGDLDARCALAEVVDEPLRWVALHLIQETARHAGHADILRETLDGTRGM